MNEAEKERLIKKDIASIENRVRHAFNQGYEMGLKAYKEKLNCTDCIIDGTDACSRGAGRAVDDERCGDFISSRSENPNTCGDAISRQEVLNAMYELCDTGETLKENPWRDNPHIDAVVEAIEELPSVTPQQRTGQWKFIVYDANRIGHYECTECHWNVLMNVSDYCPHCGAKMEV